MLGRSIVEAIHLLRCLMEKYGETYKDLHLVFINLEKTYNRVPRDVMMWVWRRVPPKYINSIKDMYDKAVISVKTS